MDDCSNIIDLAARRAEKRKAGARLQPAPAAVLEETPEARLTGDALKQRQRKVIEELRALGYEMILPTRRR